MARQVNRLTARSVASLSKPGLHADGGNLYLSVSKGGSKSWVFVYKMNGKRRELGLGSVKTVSLARAREKAQEARAQLGDGVDPMQARRQGAVTGSVASFGDIAEALITRLSFGWRNAKHAQQWRNTLRTHAAALWVMPVADIETRHVLDVLTPIWANRNETASRVRGRIEQVLDAAKALNARTGENPARWRGNLKMLLPPRCNVRKVKHHSAMPYEKVGGFLLDLRFRHHSTAARALELTILTAARTSEVLKAKWSEINMETALWIVPAERMKMRVEHRVPLSKGAITVLQHMSFLRTEEDGYVFPGNLPGKPLSNMSMEMLIRRMGLDEYTVHGFRSSFRDWAGEELDFPREIAEAALAHAVGDEVERAYRRGDALAKRRELMAAWGDHLGV